MTGAGLAIAIFLRGWKPLPNIYNSKIYRLVSNKYYVDELYERVILEPALCAARWLWLQVDVLVVDAVVNRAGAFVRWDSTWMSRVQSGFVRNYALSIFLGVIAVVGYLLVR